jgi:hypothetical protein
LIEFFDMRWLKAERWIYRNWRVIWTPNGGRMGHWAVCAEPVLTIYKE